MPNDNFLISGADFDIIQRYFARFDESFFQYCDKELLKINTFFSGELAKKIIYSYKYPAWTHMLKNMFFLVFTDWINEKSHILYLGCISLP